MNAGADACDRCLARFFGRALTHGPRQVRSRHLTKKSCIMTNSHAFDIGPIGKSWPPRGVSTSGQTCYKILHVGRKSISAPADMLVRTNNNEASRVSTVQARVRYCKHLQWNVTFGSCGDKFVRCSRIAVCDQKGEPFTEMVIERRAVGKPKVRSQTTRVRRWNIEHEVVRRRFGPIRDNNRRIHVPHSKNDPERLELTHLCSCKDVRNLAAGRFADQSRFLQIGPHQLLSGQSEVVNRFRNGPFVHRTPLQLV